MDRNPRFNEDLKFRNDAEKVRDLLWETMGTNFSELPASYLETLRHEYANGRVSMCSLMDRVDLGPEATYEEYCEVFDRLLDCDYSEFPDADSVLEVKTDRLFLSQTEDFSEDAFDFADGGDLSHKVELFLRKVISSVYTDGVSDVSDSEGNPPNPSNNFLLSEDGTQYSGIFYDRDDATGKTKEFPFTITQKGDRWQISY
jgi:hypothetical protein